MEDEFYKRLSLSDRMEYNFKELRIENDNNDLFYFGLLIIFIGMMTLVIAAPSVILLGVITLMPLSFIITLTLDIIRRNEIRRLDNKYLKKIIK